MDNERIEKEGIMENISQIIDSLESMTVEQLEELAREQDCTVDFIFKKLQDDRYILAA